MAHTNGIQGEKQLQAWWTAAAKLPESRRTRVIAGCRGLYARLHGSGAKQWLFRYRFAGRPRVMVLGRYPEMSLAEARRVAAEVRVELNKGIDPAEAKRQRIAAQEAARAARANTIGAVAAEWMQSAFVGHHAAAYERRGVEKHIIAPLGARGIADLTPAQVADWLSDLARRVGPTAAARALSFLRRMYRYAIIRQMAAVDPSAGLRLRDVGVAGARPRERTLNVDELTRLFAAIHANERIAREDKIAVELLLLTCVRKMELLGSRVEEFDLAARVWTIPTSRRSRSKGGGHVVPLTDRAVELVNELILRAAGSEWLFPARRIAATNRMSHVAASTLNRAVLELARDAEIAPFSVHDLRRTARTLLASLGVDPLIAELCLGHRIKGVMGIYDRHSYLSERRAALEKLAKLIETTLIETTKGG